MAASDNPNQPSPKLVFGSLLGIIVTALTAAGALITPDLFRGFGEWAPFWFVFVTTLIIAFGVWWKTDPLRLNTLVQAQAIAQDIVRNGQVIPEPAVNIDGPDHRAETPWPDTNKG